MIVCDVQQYVYAEIIKTGRLHRIYNDITYKEMLLARPN